MPNLIKLKAVAVDRQTLHPGDSTVEFFGDRMPNDNVDDVTAANEDMIVASLFKMPRSRELMLEVLGLTDPVLYAFKATRPFTTADKKPGDVDVILAAADAPQRSIALECKRVKVRPDYSGGERVNKVHRFQKSSIQANALATLGFSQTFLTAVAVVDGRGNDTSTFTARGMSDASFTALFQVSLDIPLTAGIGVLYIEIVQPVHAAIDESFFLTAAVLREAQCREQTQDFTALLRNYLDINGERT